MPLRRNINEYYSVLGLHPGASAKELRRAYLQLVKKWHPDRFQRSARAQFAAQEKLKAINEAYAFLKDYRPGQPWAEVDDGYSPASRYPQGATAQWREYQRRAAYRPPERDPYEGDYQYRPVGESRPGKFAWIWIAIVAANLFQSFIGGSSTRAPKQASAGVTQLNTATKGIQIGAPDERPADIVSQTLGSARGHLPYFFQGSTKADVYRIQGVPDWSSEREWRYGNSRVYFVGQTVERWENRASSPLRAMTLPRSELSNVITLGSSAVEVLAIQGVPNSVSAVDLQGDNPRAADTGRWQYGTSEIEFSRGRVVSWTEMPGSPLRVQH